MKNIFKKKTSQPNSSERITNNTVSEHRKKVLSGGRKFKYPLQYAKHRLVIMTIIISSLALGLTVLAGWWQLYPQQNTSEFAYRTVRILPVPVASVDGSPVRYSDYLMIYRSNEHYLRNKEQVNLDTDDGKRQLSFYKQKSMKSVISDAFAQKKATEYNLSVSDQEIKDKIDRQRQSFNVSVTTYDSVIKDYYGWSPDEYYHVVGAKLLKQKVMYRMDEAAKKTATDIQADLASNSTKSMQAEVTDRQTPHASLMYGSSGFVPKTNQDGGLSAKAATLQKGQLSDVIASDNGDGYYIVRLLDSNDTQVSYEFIQVRLSAFQDALVALQKNNKIQVYVDVAVDFTKED